MVEMFVSVAIGLGYPPLSHSRSRDARCPTDFIPISTSRAKPSSRMFTSLMSYRSGAENGDSRVARRGSSYWRWRTSCRVGVEASLKRARGAESKEMREGPEGDGGEEYTRYEF
jgi:hypothetical protein